MGPILYTPSHMVVKRRTEIMLMEKQSFSNKSHGMKRQAATYCITAKQLSELTSLFSAPDTCELLSTLSSNE